MFAIIHKFAWFFTSEMYKNEKRQFILIDFKENVETEKKRNSTLNKCHCAVMILALSGNFGSISAKFRRKKIKCRTKWHLNATN